MALALMARDADLAFTALTVNHGLRAEAAEEAQRVQDWLSVHGIMHHTLHWQHAGMEGNLQEKARSARYRLLAEWCRAHGVAYLLTAHHMNDQAETLLLRLKRGSHIRGLSCMATANEMHGFTLLRPLLNTPKSALVDYLRTRGQAWIEDPSNQNAAFERTHVRAFLASLPDSEQVTAALAGSAAALARLKAQQDVLINTYLQLECCFDTSGCTLAQESFRQLEESLALDVLSLVLVRIGQQPHPPRFTQLEKLYTALQQEETVKRSLGGCNIILKKGNICITASA
jgi:tRNA(Ile)-lysidine synthase